MLDNPDMQNDLVNLLPPFARAAAEKDPAFLRQASRSVLTNIQLSQNWDKARIEWLTKNSITTFDFYDRTMVALATEKLAQRNARIGQLTAEGKHTSKRRAARPTTRSPARFASRSGSPPRSTRPATP